MFLHVGSGFHHGCKFVAGMGLSVADPATLVTLNSLSPSNYDSAKSLGVLEGKGFAFSNAREVSLQNVSKGRFLRNAGAST